MARKGLAIPPTTRETRSQTRARREAAAAAMKGSVPDVIAASSPGPSPPKALPRKRRVEELESASKQSSNPAIKKRKVTTRVHTTRAGPRVTSEPPAMQRTRKPTRIIGTSRTMGRAARKPASSGSASRTTLREGKKCVARNAESVKVLTPDPKESDGELNVESEDEGLGEDPDADPHDDCYAHYFRYPSEAIERVDEHLSCGRYQAAANLCHQLVKLESMDARHYILYQPETFPVLSLAQRSQVYFKLARAFKRGTWQGAPEGMQKAVVIQQLLVKAKSVFLGRYDEEVLQTYIQQMDAINAEIFQVEEEIKRRARSLTTSGVDKDGFN